MTKKTDISKYYKEARTIRSVYEIMYYIVDSYLADPVCSEHEDEVLEKLEQIRDRYDLNKYSKKETKEKDD